ncbi:DUF6722 family protein [Parabacteroides gordonii]|jgi:hypothetical protein|uniref:Uncharacterized protein n=1 Tax=Parabacteroides gordonii MS-1 = DSM 23371 TaxID=1203610 RepID=A0A0F5IY87_9BACT|nr:DUF6722 family protein [Parabacteroides gordonii]KKB50586.1 hypothetical protein HMPREF1536_04122 [Parabacteroides gordonii MS-1 = DSM 23371]MCA5585345.1 hypothetical protein [Parabacteroides gordonii]RGP16363.1 hypothetical protein DXB27_12710 [Parabacteroides gordonii]
MSVKEKAGEFFLDIAKLVFGGIILSGIVNEPINKWVIYSLGVFFSFLLIMIGFVLIDSSKKKEVKS